MPVPSIDRPTWSDPLARWSSALIGGPAGHHTADPPRRIVTAVALAVATASWIVLTLRMLPCRSLPNQAAADPYQRMCYSDIPLLYRFRGLIDGYRPYFDTGDHQVLEYPVLTGYLLDLERRIAVLLGAPLGPGLDSFEVLIAADRFMMVNVVVMFALFGVAVAAQVASVPDRPWDALLVAGSPCVMAAGLVNWDMLPVALTACAIWAWSRSRPGLAGVLLGLGTAAKLYPVLLLGPLLLLCLRAGRIRAFGWALLGTAAAWTAANLPVMVLAPRSWLEFWTFNSDRGGDLGSIWYVLALAGHEVPALNEVSLILLLVLCAGIGALILLAPRRPRIGQVGYLVLVAFLITNKVYSPQYMLWLLPFMVLARPKGRDWAIFTAGELIYFAAIWMHLGGWLTAGSGAPDKLYWLAVLIRIGTQCWVAAMVVRDIVRPQHDPVRGPGVDDPSGGVLDHAPESDWLARLTGRAPARSASP